MGDHLIDGEFQSDKYPTTPRGFVPLKVTDKAAQPLLWAYAQSHRAIDPAFSEDLETALKTAGYDPAPRVAEAHALKALLDLAYAAWCLADDSEDLGDGYHKVDHANFKNLCDALDALYELPDDQPGYTMAEAAKARWALRHILAGLGAGEDETTDG